MGTLIVVAFAGVVLVAPLTLDPVILRMHVELLREAMDFAGLSEEKSCLWQEVDDAQFRRQCQGVGHISLTRLMKLPVTFWSWYGLLLVTKFGLPKEVRRAARVTVAVFGMKRMARMFADVQPQKVVV
jgi:hypothetical protein